VTTPPPDPEPAPHYDRVTEAWRLVLGDELHYGVFDRGDEPLPVATRALTRRMIAGAGLTPGLRVLDVGCGTGEPARYLVTTQGVRVLGITTSQVGVQLATERAAAAGLSGAAEFEVRDGTANGLPDESFDRVWVLESSHLMPARDALIAECARVLRPGGRVVLCDVIRHREIPFTELRARRAEFATLRDVYGVARMDPLASYVDRLAGEGLTVELAEDLTTATLPTFDRWRHNLERQHDEVTALLGADGGAEFARSIDILDAFWRDGTLGYGIVAASKSA
jgi:27-O-demethylrifamycin SV methyltransferase